MKKASFRAAIQIKEQKIGEKITQIANWDDEEQNPLIISKEYVINSKESLKMKISNYGNIVVLNFFQISGGISKQWWDIDTDGDKIMQNCTIFAAKRFQEAQPLFEKETNKLQLKGNSKMKEKK